MKRRNKILLVIFSILFLLGLAVYWGMNYFMNQPLYRPGNLAEANIQIPEQSPDSNFWQIASDCQLYHFSSGEGPAVLVLHGGPGIPFGEAPAGLDSLSDRFRFHYYDQRGSGRSSRPADQFSSSNFYQNMQQLDSLLGLGTQLADIERIRKILQEDQLILIGHSYGAFLAALYAGEFPDHVNSMVLIAPADLLLMPPSAGGLFEIVQEHLPSEMQEEYADYLNRYLEFGDIFSQSEAELVKLNTEFGRYFETAYRSLGLPASELAAVESGGWMVQAQYLSMGRKHDYRSALQQIKSPVLVIHGEKDLQTASVSQLYVESIPNAQLAVIPEAGHFPFFESPEEFSKIVGDFLLQED